MNFESKRPETAFPSSEVPVPAGTANTGNDLSTEILQQVNAGIILSRKKMYKEAWYTNQLMLGFTKPVQPNLYY